jgi:hypothetical protein
VVEPLIVTLLLDPEAQERSDRLRSAHFPAERNHVAAHVTLFHALPDEQGARGLRLWRRLGGPWAPVAAHPFR